MLYLNLLNLFSRHDPTDPTEKTVFTHDDSNDVLRFGVMSFEVSSSVRPNFDYGLEIPKSPFFGSNAETSAKALHLNNFKAIRHNNLQGTINENRALKNRLIS